MSNDLFQRAASRFDPPADAWEGLLRRRDRKRRNQRIAATAVGVVIATAIIVASAVTAIRRSDVGPADPDPTPSASPSLSAGPQTPLRRAGEIAIIRSNGLWAQSVQGGDRRKLADCSEPCGFIQRFAWSPDGVWIAYEVDMCGVSDCGPDAGLWVKGALGEPRQLTSPLCESDRCAYESWAWKPDGTAIADAMVDADTAGSRIFLIDPASGSRTPVLETDGAVLLIAWAPDGRRLMYVTYDRGEGTSTVFSVDPATGRSVLFANLNGGLDSIVWAPDGSKVAFDGIGEDGSSIVVANADGSGLHVVESGDVGEGPGAPSWSPDGTRIAYITTPRSPGGFRAQFWVVPIDRSAPAIKLFDGECCVGTWGGPVWSPDGAQVAFMVDGVWRTANADRSGSATVVDHVLYASWNQRAA